MTSPNAFPMGAQTLPASVMVELTIKAWRGSIKTFNSNSFSMSLQYFIHKNISEKMRGALTSKSLGAAYNRARLINGILP